MDLGLSGKRAIVTGASKGIGLAITRALVEEGARVVAGARGTSEELQGLVESGAVQEVAVDLATADGPAQLVAKALRGWLARRARQQRRRRDAPSRRLPVGHRRAMAALAQSGLHGSRPDDPRRPAGHAGGGTRHDRQHLLGEQHRSSPDPAVIDYCREAPALSNFSKALSKEVGPRGIRVRHREPGARLHRPLARRARVSRPRSRRRREAIPRPSQKHQAGEAPTGRFTRARGGRRPRGAARRRTRR